jgi:hypothetical protein
MILAVAAKFRRNYFFEELQVRLYPELADTTRFTPMSQGELAERFGINTCSCWCTASTRRSLRSPTRTAVEQG